MISEKVELSIVMPAYNEEANIERTVRACAATLSFLGRKGEIVVTDDGSLDGTLAKLKALSSEIPGLVVVEHPANRGYGAALKSAIEASRGEYIVTIDSDGQFDIGELGGFLKGGLNGTAVVTGFRTKKKDTLFRVIANRGLNSLTVALFGTSFKDINCAFRLFRGDVLRGIEIESRGYQAPSEIVIKLINKGHEVRELPVTHYARAGGRSALRPLKTITEMVIFLLYLKLKTILYRKGMITSL